MKELNETIFSRWIDEVWNQGKEDIIDEMFAEDGIADYPYHIENKLICGKEEYKKFVRFIRGLFTDIHVTIEQLAADENKAIAFCTVSAKRRSVETNMNSAQIPVKISGLCQSVFENGKIIRIWCNIDIFCRNEPRTDLIAGTGG